jgi:peptide/nickel transport system permease protein
VAAPPARPAGGRRHPALRYAARRLAAAVPVVLGVVIVTFLLLRLIPGDPARVVLGIHASPRQVAQLRRQLGLDEPVYQQLWSFLVGLAHGSTGISIYYQVPVSSLIAAALPVTASLVAVSTVFCVLITVPLASLAAARQDRPADHAVRVFSLVGLGMPSFFFGIILIIVFALDLHWFSVGGWGTTVPGHLRALVLPGLTAAIAIVPVLIRSLRLGMLEVIESDFVAAVRAKGLRGPRVLLAHVARNALIPTLTLLGINIAYLIGSTVVIERVFDLNGLGNLMLNAIGVRDFPVVQGVTLVYAIAVVAINLLTDLLGARLDPRIRLR